MKGGSHIVPLLLFLAGGYFRAPGQSVSGVVNGYFSITTVSTLTNSVVVDNATGLVGGQRVLIIQMKGATVSSTNDASFGNLTATGTAGEYEFNTICNVVGNQVWLKGAMANAYDPSGQVQLVTIPSYLSVTVAGATSGLPWDPVAGKGGVVAMEATDTIYLNADVDVSGQGFQGGALVNYPGPTYGCDWFATVNNYFLPIPASGDYTGGRKGEGVAGYILNEEYGRGKLANGGGGGNNANTGGAGGGNYGAGGAGGQRTGETTFDCHGAYPGIGGLSLATYGYSSTLNRLFLGGGGGSGHENNAAGLPGGNGGGIIILSASVIAGNGGNLVANGLSPVNAANADPSQAEGDGGGGGGAGGSIVLNAAVVTGFVSASANGARGSDASNRVNDCTGPGGGGGGGIVWSAGGGFPPAVSPSVIGGGNGVVSAGSSKTSCIGLSNGATAGAAGISQAGYSAPAPGPDVCSILATPILKYFSGSLTNSTLVSAGSQLSWAFYPMTAGEEVQSVTIERSVNQSSFAAVTTLAVTPDTLSYRYTDPQTITGIIQYRLILKNANGSVSYSPVITLERQTEPFFGIAAVYPNPVHDLLSIDLSSRNDQPATVRIFDAYGQTVRRFSANLHNGVTPLSFPVQTLASGAYFLVVEVNGRSQVRPFVKQ